MASISTSFMTLQRPNHPSLAYNRFEGKQKGLPEVLFLSGFRANMNGIKATFLDNLCQQRQQTFTRFDYSGHGSSEGDFTAATISHWLNDVLDIIDQVTKGPLILVGSSMGGWLMTLAALLRPDKIKALIGIAIAPDFTEELMWASLSDRQRQELKQQGIFHIPLSDGNYAMTLHFIEEGRKHLLLQRKNIPLSCPVYLLHGLDDHEVSWTFSERFLKKLDTKIAALTLLKDEGHRLSSSQSLQWLVTVLDKASTPTS